MEEKLAALQAQLQVAQALLGAKDMELHDVKDHANKILWAAQQLMMTVCMVDMLRYLGEALQDRPQASERRTRGNSIAIVSGAATLGQ